MKFDFGREAYFVCADSLANGETLEAIGADAGSMPPASEWLAAAAQYASEHDLPWPPPADEYEVARMKARERDVTP
ncbi:MAG: hypothetical protein ACR2I5_09815 [Candidatus Limnocylindria bacterium]